MFFDQSKSDKSFNQKRGSSGGAYGKAVVAALGLLGRPPLAGGGQSRLNPTPVNSAESNGSDVQPQIQVTNATAKPSELSAAQSSTRAVPKAPTSQPPAMSSDPADPTTPAKDASKAFPFQFGSISPGFMNGMAIPARTSSAPPNIDEQKCEQSTEVVFNTWTHDHKKCIEAQKKAAARKSLDVLLDELLSEDDSESILEEKEVPHSPISDLDLEPEQWDWNLPELPELSLPELPTWRSSSQSSPILWDLPWTDEEIRKKDAAITEHILKKEIAG